MPETMTPKDTQQLPLFVARVELPSTVAFAVPVSQPEFETETQVADTALLKYAIHLLVLLSESMVSI
jgi:hypothetical protein